MNIFITGAESTGKSTLAKQLAEYFNCSYVSEYARDYISGLEREYNIDDLEIIGRKQIDQIALGMSDPIVFFDTGLIITYIWYKKKYNFVPEWLDMALSDFGSGKYLLCLPDIPWEGDRVRENPNIRNELTNLYRSKISELGFDFKTVEGQGVSRLAMAVGIVEEWLRKDQGK